MKTPIRVLLAMLAVLALAMTVAACGDDDSDSGSTGASNTSSTEEPAASDKAIQSDAANGSTTITVGSKNFAEQYILGEIYAQ